MKKLEAVQSSIETTRTGDYGLTATQRALREAARSFAREELPALAKQLEVENHPVPRQWLKRYGDLGFLGINLPVEMGGLGLSHFDAMIVLEEFAKISVAVAFPVFESVAGPIHAIAALAEPAFATPLAKAVCRGELIIAISMSEPNAGTALTDMTTKAKIEGDCILLNGQKRWCSGGGHSDGYLVYCKLSDAPGAKGIGAVYVERDRRGVSFGAPEQLMGFRGVSSADIFFDNVCLPIENLVVPAGGFSRLMDAFDLERCGNATMSLGLAEAALEQALAYVVQRRQFGKSICEFQAVQLKIADMAMKVQAARLLTRQATSNSDQMPSRLNASMAKCFANEIVREVCGSTIQLMGGYGYHKDYGAEQRFRDSWGWGIAGGAIDIQKVNIAASLLDRRFDQRK